MKKITITGLGYHFQWIQLSSDQNQGFHLLHSLEHFDKEYFAIKNCCEFSFLGKDSTDIHYGNKKVVLNDESDSEYKSIGNLPGFPEKGFVLLKGTVYSERLSLESAQAFKDLSITRFAVTSPDGEYFAGVQPVGFKSEHRKNDDEIYFVIDMDNQQYLELYKQTFTRAA